MTGSARNYGERIMFTLKYLIMQSFNYTQLGIINVKLFWTRLKIDIYLMLH